MTNIEMTFYNHPNNLTAHIYFESATPELLLSAAADICRTTKATVSVRDGNTLVVENVEGLSYAQVRSDLNDAIRETSLIEEVPLGLDNVMRVRTTAPMDLESKLARNLEILGV